MSLMAMAEKTGPRGIGRNLAIGAALLAAVSFSIAPAYAQRGGGGGGRGGGGFHGGGFHGGGFHGGGFHGGGGHHR
jgi:Spy/CpxP family protein refolding chaperone